jgi:hypothetical protein
MTQIDHEHEIIAKLKERLEQIERENLSTQRTAEAAKPEGEATSQRSPSEDRTEGPQLGSSSQEQDI